MIMNRPLRAAVMLLVLLATAAAGCAGTTVQPAAAANAGPVTRAPESAGMSSARLERVDAALQKRVDQGELAGAEVTIARHDAVIHHTVMGVADLDTGRPVGRETLWRIYSMSKPITSVAAMMLYEEGAFLLDDPIAEYLPEYAQMTVLVEGERVPAKNPITIRQLLTHTAGFGYGFTDRGVDALYRQDHPLNRQDLAEFSQALATFPLAFEPGTDWNYGMSTDVLGRLVEVLSGMPLDQFMQQRIFDPLGMRDTFFKVPEDKLDRFASNQRMNPESGRLEVVPTPDSGIRWQQTTLFSGGGGLVSTAADYMRFSRMLARGGELDGVHLLSPKTVAFMRRNQVPAEVLGEDGVSGSGASIGFGLGFGVLRDAVGLDGRGAHAVASDGEYFWGGAAGTLFWIDPVEDLIAIVMIQRMDAPRDLRDRMRALINAAIRVPAQHPPRTGP